MYRGKLASTELFTILGGFTIHWELSRNHWHQDWVGCCALTEKETTFMNSFLKTTTSSTNGGWWGSSHLNILNVIFAELVALIAAGTVHRVCITTWMEDWFQLVGKMTQNFAVSHYRMALLFSAGLLYEINKLSGTTLSKSESKTRRH
ncbi:unnamed protein product [Camellia sinensis]